MNMKIPIGGGYLAQNKNQRKLVPKDILAHFLNVSPDDEVQVREFCRSYSFLPRNMTLGLLAGFKEEHAKITEIYNHFKSGEISNDDLQIINSELEAIHPFVRIYTGKDIVDLNSALDDMEADAAFEFYQIKREAHYPQIAYRYGSTVAILWHELSLYIANDFEIRTCANCGKYFVPSRPWSKYCPTDCKNAYRSKRKNKTK